VTDAEIRAAFTAERPFPLDPFQSTALDALDAGRSVLVAAPTGSGKTLVAEYAIARAIAHGAKAFYTTPLKALSNQKYGDFVRAYGTERVGLLTGDNAINGDAPIVVMTTEVLRNMIYAGSPALDGLRYVVLDEVHYLQDPSRGAVWEEVIIHLPADIDIVALSATVSNAEEVAAWMQTVRGATETVIEERRPSISCTSTSSVIAARRRCICCRPSSTTTAICGPIPSPPASTAGTCPIAVNAGGASTSRGGPRWWNGSPRNGCSRPSRSCSPGRAATRRSNSVSPRGSA